jgi:aryl-alcohol dehydrogenase-like predicted oxidoreductase
VKLGLGMASTRDQAARDQAVVDTAYELGIRHFDTASNYGSDHLLKSMPDDAIIISKVGYHAEPHRCKTSVGDRHCLTTSCLRVQYESMTTRMGRRPNILLLHNPEEQLAMGVCRAEWERRMRRAFEFLTEVNGTMIGAAVWNAAIHPEASPAQVDPKEFRDLALESIFFEMPLHMHSSVDALNWHTKVKENWGIVIASSPLNGGKIGAMTGVTMFKWMKNWADIVIPGTNKPSRVKEYAEAYQTAMLESGVLRENIWPVARSSSSALPVI